MAQHIGTAMATPRRRVSPGMRNAGQHTRAVLAPSALLTLATDVLRHADEPSMRVSRLTFFTHVARTRAHPEPLLTTRVDAWQHSHKVVKLRKANVQLIQQPNEKQEA